MASMTVIVTVAAIWSVAAVTPGPNGFAILRCAIGGRRRGALAAAAGVVTGTLIWGLAGWLGIGALFAAAPLAYAVVKILGAAYLIWLGAGLLIGAARRRPDTGAETPALAVAPLSAWRIGLATNLSNPKTAIFVASLFAVALPAAPHWSDGAAAVAVMVAVSGAWYAALGLALSSGAAARGFQRFGRWIDAAAGAVFLGFGARLALSER